MSSRIFAPTSHKQHRSTPYAHEIPANELASAEHGYEAANDEIKAFAKPEAKKQNQELSDGHLDAFAAGRNEMAIINSGPIMLFVNAYKTYVQ